MSSFGFPYKRKTKKMSRMSYLCMHAQPCLTLCDPVDCSLSGSSVHGVFQARVLEWGAIAFSTDYSRYLI